MTERPLVVVNYGGGSNSTALLVEAHRRGVPVDLIVFADTGSERPETYRYLDVMDEWLSLHGMPTIERVRWIRKRGKYAGQFIPLHEWCEIYESLPSKAFGLPGCTVKWKQQPADSYIREHELVLSARSTGRPVHRWIGYDADEPGRYNRMMSARAADDEWAWKSPLIEWDMGRHECIESIVSAGLPLPGKSACWLCPSMKQHEIDDLERNHPNLLRKALEIERNAKIDRTKIRGLGRSLNWSEYLKQPSLFDAIRTPDDACGCYDGGSDD